jgi:hypothetical protein
LYSIFSNTFEFLVIFFVIFVTVLTKGSTSGLRNHIKGKHPNDWAKVLQAEKEKAERDAANKEEAQKLQEEMEGDADEIEEDLTQTPGPSSRKRPADEVMGETPKRPRAGDKLSPRKSMFTKVRNFCTYSNLTYFYSKFSYILKFYILFFEIFVHTQV